MPASTSQRRTKPKVRRNSDVIPYPDPNRFQVVSCFSRFVGTSAAVIPVRFGRVGLAVIPVLLAGLNYFFQLC